MQILKKLSKTRLFSFLAILIPAVAIAAIVTASQVADAVRNSPTANAWLKANADAVGALAINVESGGNTQVYNGSCCYGVLQMNKTNIRTYAGMTPEQFRNADLQTQVNAWSKVMSAALNDRAPKLLASMGTFAGRPVTANMVLACVQLGQGNCMTMIQSGSCSGFADRNKTTICAMADKIANGSAVGTGSGGGLGSNEPHINGAGMLDKVLMAYSDATGGWGDDVTKAAENLFWILVVISMVWTFGIMAVRRADLGEFFAEFIKFTVFTGFFWWLLTNGSDFTYDIISSLRQMGGEAGGTNALTPSYILDTGFEIFGNAISGSSIWAPGTSAAGIIIGIIILVVLALVGINMLLLLVSGWILGYAGIFFLGFGGSRWTSDMAINYFKTVLNIAVQLFTMVLIVGIGKSFFDEYYQAMSKGSVQLEEMGIILIVSVVLLGLVNKLPPMLGGIVTGGGTSALGGGFGLSTAVGAAAAVGAAVATAGAAAAAGAANLAGGASALHAAFKGATGGQNSPASQDDVAGSEQGNTPMSQAMGTTT